MFVFVFEFRRDFLGWGRGLDIGVSLMKFRWSLEYGGWILFLEVISFFDFYSGLWGYF